LRETEALKFHFRAILDELRQFRDAWTLIDVGAGAGDLLIGAERLGIANPSWEYIAVQEDPKAVLLDRVTRSREEGRIASSSRIVARLEDCPSPWDATVFANTCHALPLERLAEWLAIALQGLRRRSSSQCVVHEVEVLRRGEHGYVIWDSKDFQEVCAAIPGIAVMERPYPRDKGVPIHTTLLRRNTEHELPMNLASQLLAGFLARLHPKLRDLLRKREELGRKGDIGGSTMRERLRQRSYAFVSEQCSNIVAIRERLAGGAGDQDP